MHRQFVMGNEQRYFYDYYMILGGPVPLPERVLYHEGVVKAFAADGTFDPGLVETGPQSKSNSEQEEQGIMTPVIAKYLWLACVIAWWLIRFPYERRARKARVTRERSATRAS